ncbi:MAG: sulfatase, partial [Planctomycetota bacterium]
MNRHQALVTSLMVAVLSAGSFVEHVRAADRPAQPPNVLFILADDLGWGDLGCYGHRLLRTPNLDRMARQGTLFTHFYVNGSVCSPSRAAFTTSHFPARHAVHGHFATHASNAERAMPNFLDPKVHTVARLLKQAGYATGHIGKWHLSTMHTDREASGEPRIEDYGFGFVGSGETGGAD